MQKVIILVSENYGIGSSRINSSQLKMKSTLLEKQFQNLWNPIIP